MEEIPASTRRYPLVGFQPDRDLGKDILTVKNISKTVDGVKLLDNVYFTRGNTGDKIAFRGRKRELAQTTLFKILMGELDPDEGSIKWGVSTFPSYLPKDNTEYFEGCTMELVDWIAPVLGQEGRCLPPGFLGRMLFSGDDVFKPVKVLSGGEKVRCMLSRMMLSGANVVLLDQPTNHLDMESIQAVNKGPYGLPGVVLWPAMTTSCSKPSATESSPSSPTEPLWTGSAPMTITWRGWKVKKIRNEEIVMKDRNPWSWKNARTAGA